MSEVGSDSSLVVAAVAALLDRWALFVDVVQHLLKNFHTGAFDHDAVIVDRIGSDISEH